MLTSASTRLAFSLLMLSNTFFTLLVIDSALAFVTKSLVRIRNLLELFFCCVWVILITIRMVLDGEFLERLLDFLFRRVFLDSKELVVVFSFWLGLLLLSLLLTAMLCIYKT